MKNFKYILLVLILLFSGRKINSQTELKQDNLGNAEKHSESINSVESTPRALFISGQLGYCLGSSITLKTLVLSPSSLPTYTWTDPSGTTYNTQSITVTPSTTTTYSLSYHDNAGTMTVSVTVYQLPTDECNSCQLVQNGALETYQNCHNTVSNIIFPSACWTNAQPYPFLGTNISDVVNWTSPTCGTSDYFTAGFHSGNYGTPVNNNTANTPPHSGNAYAGLIPYYNRPGAYSPYAFEYIQSQLKCPLVQGQTYNVYFYASLSNLSAFIASNNIGAYLSQSPISSITSTVNLSYTPQVNSTSSIPATNPGTWTQVSGAMVGNNEQYITIGNFYPLAQTIPYPTAGEAYYFIDDISVLPATPTLTASSMTVNCNVSTPISLIANGAANAYTSWTDGVNTYSGNTISIPSPSSTKTYTCIVSLPCGSCTPLTQTITITAVNSSPATFSNPNPVICPGNQTALTINGGNNYIWAPSTGLNITTGNSVTASPTSTTNYTVSYTDICSNISTATITVIVNPLPVVTASSTSICTGSFCTLNANGAASYNWLPSTGLNSASGASVIANPATTTVYTITGISPVGCVNTATTSVTVNPVPAAFTVNNATITCSVSAVTLKVQINNNGNIANRNAVSENSVDASSITYTWLPTTGLNISTGTVVTANPTATTIYTITATNSFGCSYTTTATVYYLASLPSSNALFNIQYIPVSGANYWTLSANTNTPVGAISSWTVQGTYITSNGVTQPFPTLITQYPANLNPVTFPGYSSDPSYLMNPNAQLPSPGRFIYGLYDVYYHITHAVWNSTCPTPVIYSWSSPIARHNLLDSLGSSGEIFPFSVGVNKLTGNENELSIYPNPSSTILNIEGSIINENKEIQIVDLLGNLILKYMPLNTSHVSIDISGLNNGAYFIHINKSTYKFIKQ